MICVYQQIPFLSMNINISFLTMWYLIINKYYDLSAMGKIENN